MEEIPLDLNSTSSHSGRGLGVMDFQVSKKKIESFLSPPYLAGLRSVS